MTTVDRLQRPPTAGVREMPFVLRTATVADGEPADGLTLDGYGAVFGSRTIIDSYEGRFAEQFAIGSMKRSFRETPPKVQFDHGRHPMIGSIPIAALRSITEEVDPVLAPNGGAHIVARVFDNWLMAPVRDAIAAEAISGMSMRFSVVREQWTTSDGRNIRDEGELMQLLRQAIYDDVPDDQLPMRTVKEAKVPEMGPVVWPAYQDTSVSMRSVIDLGRLHEPKQRDLLARAVFIADAVTAGSDRAASAPADADDADDDAPALAGALDAILDQASGLIDGVDLTTLPPEVAQALSLIVAAETAADALLESMGIYDPDDDEATEGRNELGRAASHHPVGEHPSTPVDIPPTVHEDAQRSTPAVGERPSTPRPFTQAQLRLRNQRDRLLTLRAVGDRPL